MARKLGRVTTRKVLELPQQRISRQMNNLQAAVAGLQREVSTEPVLSGIVRISLADNYAALRAIAKTFGWKMHDIHDLAKKLRKANK